MARFDLSFVGDKALQAQLAGLTDKLERRILTQAIRQATREVLLPAIQANTPVGSPYTQVRRGRTVQGDNGAYRRVSFRQQTGRLRRSWRVRALPRRRGRVGSVVQAGTRQQLGITGRSFYPAHQEFGYKTRGGRRRIVVHQQFVKRPLLRQRVAWLQAVARGMAQGFEREVHP
jgi:hypothetical protein